MFSVVIPLYNKELSIDNTINSVLNQTFTDFEIVIVNDGSTDNSYNVVKKIEDDRIRLINKENGGASSARNKGIKEAKFDWICLLDADDLWLPNHLETLLEMIKIYPNNYVFSTGYIRSNAEFPKENLSNIIQVKDYFLAENKYFFCSSVACIHKLVFAKCGLFLEQFSRGEDLEMWQRIGRYYSFITNKRITAIYRIGSENQITSSLYDYSKSTISILNERYPNFDRISEKKYILTGCKTQLFIYIRRRDVKSFLKLFLQTIKIIKNPIKKHS